MLKQNIIFIENKAGSLQKATGILKKEEIEIFGFACFDAPEFALFRMVCSDAEKAEKVLSENGYMNRISRVIAVDLKDCACGLDDVLQVLAESNISLNYIYPSCRKESMSPVMILHSEELTVTESVLKNKGFRLLEGVDEWI